MSTLMLPIASALLVCGYIRAVGRHPIRTADYRELVEAY